MAYWLDKWLFDDSIEYEFKFAGNYGAKGEKRQKKKKATPEQIKKQNQRNREIKTRRLIKANWTPGSYWVALNYPRGTRKPYEEVEKDFEKLIGRMRYRYKKQGDELKWLCRIEIGKRGGIHIHILINRPNGKKTADQIVSESWTSGRAHFTTIYEDGGYKDLAEYIAKPPPEKQENNEDAVRANRIRTSRNLIRPQPERKYYTRRTVEKMIRYIQIGEFRDIETPGFHIDPDSVVMGVNRFTGYSYLKYTEFRIRKKDGRCSKSTCT